MSSGQRGQCRTVCCRERRGRLWPDPNSVCCAEGLHSARAGDTTPFTPEPGKQVRREGQEVVVGPSVVPARAAGVREQAFQPEGELDE